MRTRSAAVGILTLAVLASTLTVVTVTDTEPASAHVAYAQDCTWVQSTNYTIIGYRWDPNQMYWHDFGNDEGEYRYGVPIWGYERYRRCGPRYERPHTHNQWLWFGACGVIGRVSPAVGLYCGATGIQSTEGH